MNECMPKIATSCKINVVFMFTFVYIYIDFNDQVAILGQYGNGLSLVAFEWFQVSDLKSVSAMLLSEFSTDGSPYD